MAKCPKCQARKGKRYCPALEEGICAQCCAEHRLKTIRCPTSCPHLASEHYQLAKRREKAQSSGRKFILHLYDLFRNEESREFAFLLQTDCYWWMGQNGPLANGLCVQVLAELKSRLSPVFVPAVHPQPLAKFLHELSETGERHKNLLKGKFTEQHRSTALQTLERHVGTHGPAESFSYHQELDDYFGHLDFEADLDYSPTEQLGNGSQKKPADTFQRHTSGLILPGR